MNPSIETHPLPASAAAGIAGRRLGEILVERRLVSGNDVGKALAF